MSTEEEKAMPLLLLLLVVVVVIVIVLVVALPRGTLTLSLMIDQEILQLLVAG
jgi:hypothetical protein